MKTSRIVADRIEIAFGPDSSYTAFIASNPEEAVEVFFKTMQIPAVTGALIKSGQDAVKKMSPEIREASIFKYFEHARFSELPEVIDVCLTDEGNALCINIGSGALIFRLSESAKRVLDEPLQNL